LASYIFVAETNLTATSSDFNAFWYSLQDDKNTITANKAKKFFIILFNSADFKHFLCCKNQLQI
jgi:hypothetical protein